MTAARGAAVRLRSVLVADQEAGRAGDDAAGPTDPPDIAPAVRSYPGARRPDRSWWVDSSGLRIAAYEWGDPEAPVVLAAHGGFDFAGTFDVFGPMLADAGWRFVSWDARGHGNSQRAVLYSWAGDLRDAAAVLDSCQVDRVAVLGHSKGGGVVLDMAHALPHRLTHLINLDGGLAHRERTAGKERRPGTINDLALRRRRMNPRLSVEWLEYLVALGAAQDADGSDNWRWKIDPVLRMGGFGPWRPEWSMERVPGVGCPFLGILGLEIEDLSWGTRPEDVYPNLPPGAEFHALEGVGHFVHIEQPRLVADLVLDFLSRRADG